MRGPSSTDAHDRFQRARAAERAIEAMVYLGLAQTDLAQLSDAEQTCRAAYSAASALGDPEADACFRRSRSRARCSGSGATRTRDRYWKRSRHWRRRAVRADTGAWPRGSDRRRRACRCMAGGRSAPAAASSLSPAIESVVRECEARQGGSATSSPSRPRARLDWRGSCGAFAAAGHQAAAHACRRASSGRTARAGARRGASSRATFAAAPFRRC